MNSRKTYHTIPELTSLYSFAIILVEIGHSRIASSPRMNPECYWFIWKVIYSFHMHLFMFFSGFLFIHTHMDEDRIDYIEFMTRKAKRLILPYVSLMSLAVLVRMILFEFSSKKVQLGSIFLSFVHPSFCAIDYYWFIICLFLIFAISPILHGFIVVKQDYKPVVVTTVLFFCLYVYRIDIKYFFIYKISEYAIFFWLGCVFYRFREKFNRYLDHDSSAPILFAALIALNLTGSQSALIGLLTAITGILFSYSLILVYNRNNLSFLKKIDGFNYQIFLLSWFFHKGAELLFYKIWGFGFYAFFPISFGISLFSSILITKMVAKYLPRLKPVIGISTLRLPRESIVTVKVHE